MGRNVHGNISDDTGPMIVQVHTFYDVFIQKPSLKPLETPQVWTYRLHEASIVNSDSLVVAYQCLLSAGHNQDTSIENCLYRKLTAIDTCRHINELGEKSSLILVPDDVRPVDN